MQDTPKGSLILAMFWMALISLLLFWLPLLGPLIAGFVGGRTAGSVGRALLAAILPALLLSVLLFVLVTMITVLPLIGALAAGGTFLLILVQGLPLLLGAFIGGLSA